MGCLYPHPQEQGAWARLLAHTDAARPAGDTYMQRQHSREWWFLEKHFRLLKSIQEASLKEPSLSK